MNAQPMTSHFALSLLCFCFTLFSRDMQFCSLNLKLLFAVCKNYVQNEWGISFPMLGHDLFNS